MAYLAQAVYDAALQYIADNGLRVDICSQAPSSYTEAVSTYSLGNKTVSIGAPEAAGSGRKVVVPAISDGAITGNGTATHWAITDGASLLIAWQTLTSSELVSNGQQFQLPEQSVTLPPVA